MHRNITVHTLRVASLIVPWGVITDFQLATHETYSRRPCGLELYRSPEMSALQPQPWNIVDSHHSVPSYDNQVDVYGLGLAMFELWHGKHLVRRGHDRLGTGESDWMEVWHFLDVWSQLDVYSTIARLLKGMLRRNPKDRWTAAKTLEEITTAERDLNEFLDPPDTTINWNEWLVNSMTEGWEEKGKGKGREEDSRMSGT